MTTVRDKLWIWGHNVGAHDPDTTWKLPRPSRMTPVEGAVYLGLSNIFMIWLWSPKCPEPLPSWRQYALPFRAMKKVVWSIGHSGGLSFTDHVLPLVASFPNMGGLILDDFFTARADGHFAALDDQQLAELRRRMALPDRRLDLWCVVYEQDLGKPIAATLAGMDALFYAVWNSVNLPDLESQIQTLGNLAPGKPVVVGLYMWDYALRRPMPMDLVRLQCRIALDLLRGGKIDGIAFIASCICDMELEAVEWTREWIAQVGDEVLEA